LSFFHEIILALFVSETFSWREHSEHVVGKLESAVFFINSLCKTVNEAQLKMVYYVWAYSIMSNGIFICGGSVAAPKYVFVVQ